MLEYFIAGGSVRDILLGREVKDVDCVFGGSAENFLHRFPQARNTGSHPDIWIAGGCEFTALDGGIGGDLERRDLTINACIIDRNGRFHAHPRFAEDLRERRLRLVSRRVLEDDPLRVFRVARFAAALPDFSVAGETLDMMRDFSLTHQKELAELPRERMMHELMRVLESPRPSNFLRVLHNAGSLSPWFREFAGASSIPAGPLPWHDNSVLEHTLEVMDKCSGHPFAVWMAICHDLGKMRTDPAILPHHFGHEKIGGGMARQLGERLGMPNKYIRAGVVGTLCHMKGGMYGTLRSGTRRDMLFMIKNAGIFHDFWILAGADGNIDWEPAASRDLDAMDSVRLPEEWRGRGPLSGQHLRNLQCEAISRVAKVKEKLL